jgi:HPt (histidine-containing phosphotransfer) domain-containing protein
MLTGPARTAEPMATPTAKPERAGQPVTSDDLGVDRAALATLQEDVGGAGALARIVRLFLDQLEPQAEQIEAAAGRGELDSLARAAHRMKSSSATLGAIALADVLGQLEATARRDDAQACLVLAGELAATVLRARAALEDVLEGLEAAN